MALSFQTLELASLLMLVGCVALAFVFVVRETGLRTVTAPLRKRFVLGVPWGTLVVVLGVLAVYFLLQGGGQRGGPVVVGFRSWSFSYPSGLVLAPFSHSSEGHITGNLLSTVAFAPLVEYVWSHYPVERGSHSFGSWPTNPFVRIALFVVGVVLVGILTSVFIPGTVIGFSGVVFAFGGFALVTRPLPAIVLLVAERVVAIGYRAIQSPVVFARGREQFVTPSWADIAIQGHAMGLFVGFLLGLLLVRRRDDWPDIRYVWFAVLAFTVGKSLYALYWYLSGTEYILFQAIGLGLLFVLATIVAFAFAEDDPMVVSRIDLSRRELAAGLVVCFVLAIALAAVPYNLVSVPSGPEAENGIEVRDYTVTYAEGVPNRYVSSVQIPGLRDSLTINTSGVIVTSERRDAWEVVVPAGRLAVQGQTRVPVGGIGWRETVVVNRTGWVTQGGERTYKVFARREDGQPERVFTSGPANVSGRLNYSRIQLRPANQGFRVAVQRNGSVVGTGPVPASGTNATIGGLTFARTNGTLGAGYGGTRIDIAGREN